MAFEANPAYQSSAAPEKEDAPVFTPNSDYNPQQDPMEMPTRTAAGGQIPFPNNQAIAPPQKDKDGNIILPKYSESDLAAFDRNSAVLAKAEDQGGSKNKTEKTVAPKKASISSGGFTPNPAYTGPIASKQDESGNDVWDHVKGGALAAGDFLGAIPGSVAAGAGALYGGAKALADNALGGNADPLEEVAKWAQKGMHSTMPSTYFNNLSPEVQRGLDEATKTLMLPAEYGAKGLKAAQLIPFMFSDEGREWAQEMMDNPEMAPAWSALTETLGMIPGYRVAELGLGKAGSMARGERPLENPGRGANEPLPGTNPDIVAPVESLGKKMTPEEEAAFDAANPDPAMGQRPRLNIANQEPTLNPQEVLPDNMKSGTPEDAARTQQVLQGQQGDMLSDPKTASPLENRFGEAGDVLDLDQFKMMLEQADKASGNVKTRGPEEVKALHDAYLEDTNHTQGQLFDRVADAQQFTDKAKAEAEARATNDAMVQTNVMHETRLETPDETQQRVTEAKEVTTNIQDTVDRLSLEDPLAANGRVAIQNLNELQEKLGKLGNITGEVVEKIQSDKYMTGQMNKINATRDTINGLIEDAKIVATQGTFIKEGNLARTKAAQNKVASIYKNIQAELAKLESQGNDLYSRLGDKHGEFFNEPNKINPNFIKKGSTYRKGQTGAVDPEAFRILGQKVKAGWKALTDRPDKQLGEAEPGFIDDLARAYYAGKSTGEPEVFSSGRKINKGPGGSQSGAVDPKVFADALKKVSKEAYDATKLAIAHGEVKKQDADFTKTMQNKETMKPVGPTAQATLGPNLSKKILGSKERVEPSFDGTPSKPTEVSRLLTEYSQNSMINTVKEKLDAIKNTPTFQNLARGFLPLALGPAEAAGLVKDFANKQATALYAKARLMQILNGLKKDELKQLYDARQRDEVAEKAGDSSGPNQAKLPEKLSKIAKIVQEDYRDALQEAQSAGVIDGGYEHYTPRKLISILDDGTVKSLAELTRRDQIGGVYGPKKSMSELKGRKYTTAEETEAAARAHFGDNVNLVRDIRVLPHVTADLRRVTATKTLIEEIRKYGADNFTPTVSTEPIRGWSTINHPAFKNVWIHPDFLPGIESILSQNSSAKGFVDALMTIKAKSMGLLMFNPFIHGTVIWSKAMPYDPMRVISGYAYMKGGALRGSALPSWMSDIYGIKERATPEQGWAYQKEAMETGFRPPSVATNGAQMEVSGAYGEPAVGNSWTAQLAGKAASLFNKEVEAKQGVDAVGEFWHGSLLWNRITDLGMYIWDKSWRDLVKEGMDEKSAKVTASHIANRYMGTVPYEAMGAPIRTLLNITLFSRQFNVTNLGIYKDIISGLPNEIKGQIKDAQQIKIANTYLQTKQGKALLMDIIVLNTMVSAAIQTGVAVFRNYDDIKEGISKEGAAYAKRLGEWFDRMGDNPTAILDPQVSPLSHNEPGKEERPYLGNDSNGTGMYMKNPLGKVGEDLIGAFKHPITTLANKQSQFLKFLMGNGFKGGLFSKDIWGPNDQTLTNMQKLTALLKLTADSFLPFGNVDSVSELMKGNPNKINALKTAGSLTPISFSKGYPGGPKQGVLAQEQASSDFRFLQDKKQIDNMIDRSDYRGANNLLLKHNKSPEEAVTYIQQRLGMATPNVDKVVKLYKDNPDAVKQYNSVNNY